MKMDRRNDGLEELIAGESPKLKAFIRRRVPSKEDAEDILQDTMYVFVKTLSEALDPVGQVSAWLYRVARNLIINHGKKMREEELPLHYDEEGHAIWEDLSDLLLDEDSPTPETEYMRSLVWRELEAALAELPEEQRTVFRQTELEGLSFKEISRQTGVTVNTLLSRKHEAVKHLRRRLEKLYREIIYQ